MNGLKEYTAKLSWHYEEKQIPCFIAGCTIYVCEFKAKSTAHALSHTQGCVFSTSQTYFLKFRSLNYAGAGAEKRCFNIQILHILYTGHAGSMRLCKRKEGESQTARPHTPRHRHTRHI